MSKYTTELRYICESLSFNSIESHTINEIVEKARPKIFDFDYPIFDESYRKILETKILRNYYFREIGMETYALWKAYLDTELNNIMPYYNQLYKSELLKFDPFIDVDTTRKSNNNKKDVNIINRETNKNNENIQNKNNNTNAKNISAFSDTPQGALDNVVDLKYLSSATTDTNELNDKQEQIEKGNVNEKNVSTDTLNSTDEYLETFSGKQGGESYSSLLLKYRETFLNIDKQIIEELSPLFFGLY